jgi:hypothetical protein
MLPNTTLKNIEEPIKLLLNFISSSSSSSLARQPLVGPGLLEKL